jgi:hypothetical protein
MGAISEKVRYELFQVPGTINTRSLILWVDEKYFKANTVLTAGTTLANFMSAEDIPKGDALDSFGSLVYTGQEERSGGCLRFCFVPPYTGGDIATPVLSIPEFKPAMSWPAVLLNLNIVNFEAKDNEGNNYLADVTYIPYIKEGFSGAVRTLDETFVSQTKFNIPVSPTFRPQPMQFYFGIGSFSLSETLHPLINFNVSFGPNTRYPASSFSASFPATNYIDWPASMVVRDEQKFVNGMWIRNKLTAYKPDT